MLSLVGLIPAIAIAAADMATVSPPSQIGSRTAVVEFTTDGNASTLDAKVILTESLPLSDTTLALVKAGHIKPDTSGVTHISGNTFRVSVSYPVKNDGEPLPVNLSLPVPRVRQPPSYPFVLRKQGITGGALVQLTINEKGLVKNVEVLRSSHPEFGSSAAQALERWQFSKPAKKDGKPIPITIMQLVTFQLDNQPAPLEWRISPQPSLETFIIGIF